MLVGLDDSTHPTFYVHSASIERSAHHAERDGYVVAAATSKLSTFDHTAGWLLDALAVVAA